MTLSRENFQRPLLFLALMLVAQVVHAIAAPEAEIAAAAAAIAAAEHAQPRGQAAGELDQARNLLAQAQAFVTKRKFRDAVGMANQAQALAALAQARARQAQAQQEVDEKTARNADLRRQLLVLPAAGQ